MPWAQHDENGKPVAVNDWDYGRVCVKPDLGARWRGCGGLATHSWIERLSCSRRSRIKFSGVGCAEDCYARKAYLRRERIIGRMVLKRGVEPGESEFSHAGGMMPNVQHGYVPEQIDQMRAERRTDTTDAGSVASYDDLGNPDRFGAQPALQRPYVAHKPSTNFPPEVQTGVKRAR